MSVINPSMSPNNDSPEQVKEYGLEIGFASIEKNHPNQDALLIDKDLGLFAVFDGAGGHKDGDVASKSGVENLRKIYSDNPQANLTEAIKSVSDEISKKTKEGATTAAIVKVSEIYSQQKEMKIQITAVGDSRVYIISKEGHIKGITVDNVNQKTEEAEVEEALRRQTKLSSINTISDIPQEYLGDFHTRYGISEYLGKNKLQEPRIYETIIKEEDVIVICSDGVHDNLTDKNITDMIEQSESVQAIADRISKEAVAVSKNDTARSKPDDTSVIVLRYSDMINNKPNLKDFLLDSTSENEAISTPMTQQRDENWYDNPKIESALEDIAPQPFREGQLPRDEIMIYSINSMKFPISVQLGEDSLELSIIEKKDQTPKIAIAIPGKTAGEYFAGKYILQIDPNGLDQRFIIGRNNQTTENLGVDLGSTVSRNHLEIGFDGKSISLLDRSTNGTELYNAL